MTASVVSCVDKVSLVNRFIFKCFVYELEIKYVCCQNFHIKYSVCIVYVTFITLAIYVVDCLQNLCL